MLSITNTRTMTQGAYHHAVVFSPTTYARPLYNVDTPDALEVVCRHSDSSRHLATQLMSKYSDLTVLAPLSYGVNQDDVPPDVWQDADRFSACFFSQASRIIIYVPPDGEHQLQHFTQTCLVPLLTQPGGRPEWHSRFVVAAVGNVSTPTHLGPDVPFISVVRFREIGWVRDVTALMMLQRVIKDFWIPSKKPGIKHWRLNLTASIGYSLNETTETDSEFDIHTMVTGQMEAFDMDGHEWAQRVSSPNALGQQIRSIRPPSKSRSRSRSRHTSSSGYRSLDPEFEAQQNEEFLINTRLIHVVPFHNLVSLQQQQQLLPQSRKEETPEIEYEDDGVSNKTNTATTDIRDHSGSTTLINEQINPEEDYIHTRENVISTGTKEMNISGQTNTHPDHHYQQPVVHPREHIHAVTPEEVTNVKDASNEIERRNSHIPSLDPSSEVMAEHVKSLDSFSQTNEVKYTEAAVGNVIDQFLLKAHKASGLDRKAQSALVIDKYTQGYQEELLENVDSHLSSESITPPPTSPPTSPPQSPPQSPPLTSPSRSQSPPPTPPPPPRSITTPPPTSPPQSPSLTSPSRSPSQSPPPTPPPRSIPTSPPRSPPTFSPHVEGDKPEYIIHPPLKFINSTEPTETAVCHELHKGLLWGVSKTFAGQEWIGETIPFIDAHPPAPNVEASSSGQGTSQPGHVTISTHPITHTVHPTTAPQIPSEPSQRSQTGTEERVLDSARGSYWMVKRSEIVTRKPESSPVTVVAVSTRQHPPARVSMLREPVMETVQPLPRINHHEVNQLHTIPMKTLLTPIVSQVHSKPYQPVRPLYARRVVLVDSSSQWDQSIPCLEDTSHHQVPPMKLRTVKLETERAEAHSKQTGIHEDMVDETIGASGIERKSYSKKTVTRREIISESTVVERQSHPWTEWHADPIMTPLTVDTQCSGSNETVRVTRPTGLPTGGSSRRPVKIVPMQQSPERQFVEPSPPLIRTHTVKQGPSMQRGGSLNRTIFIRSTRPVVNERVFWDESQRGRSREYSPDWEVTPTGPSHGRSVSVSPQQSRRHITRLYPQPWATPKGITCADAFAQIRAPLESGYWATRGVACYGFTGTRFPKRLMQCPPRMAVYRDMGVWTGPDSAETYRIEMLFAGKKPADDSINPEEGSVQGPSLMASISEFPSTLTTPPTEVVLPPDPSDTSRVEGERKPQDDMRTQTPSSDDTDDHDAHPLHLHLPTRRWSVRGIYRVSVCIVFFSVLTAYYCLQFNHTTDHLISPSNFWHWLVTLVNRTSDRDPALD